VGLGDRLLTSKQEENYLNHHTATHSSFILSTYMG